MASIKAVLSMNKCFFAVQNFVKSRAHRTVYSSVKFASPTDTCSRVFELVPLEA